MKELYTSPKAEVIEFDAKDVITTSGGFADIALLSGEAANSDVGWSGLY